jgi:hypothetical protein
MIKNLPAMWKIYKGFKNASKTSDNETEHTGESTEAAVAEADHNEEVRTSKKSRQIRNNQQSTPPKKRAYQNGSSVPKMYI